MSRDEIETKVEQAFIETMIFEPDDSERGAKVDRSIEYAGDNAWDSIAHMTLAATLEEFFNIMLDTEQIIQMSSFSRVCDIIAEALE